ncbi:MAG TPA: hypothetical protein VNT56_07755, partial [Acidimicrobiales bacterium]|nr:hypothetical protein [Acidimicrobiales bacterium]
VPTCTADAAELLLAGASAVQVGTATFGDPQAPARVLDELQGWAARHRVTSVADVVGAVHQRGTAERARETEMGR